MSIKKTIHYLWLSDEKPKAVEKCLESWEKHLKDYEIIEWNKTNFPYNDFLYTREAFSKKKWAFVTDFFRLWVLEKYGGIYLDADVTLNGNFDSFLEDNLFIGVESTDQIAAHAIGAEPGHPFIRKCLDYYQDRHFILPDGTLDQTPIPCIITKIFMNMYKYEDEIVKYDGKPVLFSDMKIYPDPYFTINTYDGHNVCVHNGLGSWRDDSSDNPILENVMTLYFWRKFCRHDIYSIKAPRKWVYLFVPVWVLSLVQRYHAKIKCNKRAARVKLK